MQIKIKDLIFDFPFVESRGEVFEKNAFIFREGEPIEYVFYIQSGSVKVVKEGYLLWEAKANELIGVSSFFSAGGTYHFSVKTSTEAKVLGIKVSDFKEMLASDTDFAKHNMKMISERIQLTNSKSKNLMNYSSKSRLIKEMLRRMKKGSSKTIEFTYEEISEIIGVSKKFIQRLLSDFEKKDLIKRFQNKLILKDVNGLKTEGEL